MKHLFKKEKNNYVLTGDDSSASRTYIEKEWMANHKPTSQAILLKSSCFESIGACKGYTNYKCLINGATK